MMVTIAFIIFISIILKLFFVNMMIKSMFFLIYLVIIQHL